MAGFGALLGAGRLLEAAIWTAGIGGLMALGVIGFSWLRAWSKSGQEQVSSRRRFRMRRPLPVAFCWR